MGQPIGLIPIGPIDGELLAWLQSRLPDLTGSPVHIGAEVPLPAHGFDPLRNQYQGDVLLAILRDLPYPNLGRLLGFTDADCYAAGLNFIFGQAVVGGREAFVALPRLRQTYYGLEHNEELFRQRVLKEAIHELGHTWSLPHCPDPLCVMYFSDTLQDTDVKQLELCDRCRQQLDLASLP
jgi:archaemetzincin